jgi:hypothetical protein
VDSALRQLQGPPFVPPVQERLAPQERRPRRT